MQGSCNPVAVALHRHLAPGLPATVRGRLFALPDPAGWYPALLPDPAAGPVHGPVHGTVHEALPGFTPDHLTRLDAYEDSAGEAGEYRRESIALAVAGGTLAATVYVYNVPLPPAARPLPHGDFRRFLSETGEAPFR